MGCGCGGSRKVVTMPNSTMSSSGNFTPESLADSSEVQGSPNQIVEVEYLGEKRETFSLRSRVDPNVMYRFGNNEYNKVRAVFLYDAEWLIGMTDEFGSQAYPIVVANAPMEERDPT